LNTRISQLVSFLVVSIVLSTSGHAFTLGDLRGSAVLGQPLDVSVRVDTGDGETVADDCLSAQLLFGDVPQAAPTLRVQNPAAGASPLTLVRIRSSVAVNEPIVTVVLRATCGSTTSRSYVLLSDFPVTDLPVVNALPVEQPAAVTSPSQAKPAPVVTELQPLPTSPSPLEAKAKRPAVAAKPKPAKVASATPVAAKTRPTAPPPVSEAPLGVVPSTVPDTGRLVLKLDSEIDLLSPEELSALAALRVSLPQLEPEGEVLKQSMQLEALQNDLKVFKDLTSKNQAALAALEAKLSQAESERLPVAWLYLLGALLLAALGALAWVLRQQQHAKQAWWQQADGSPTEMIGGPVTRIEPVEPVTAVSPMMPTPAPSEPAAPAAPVVPVVQEAPLVDLDFDLDQLVGTAGPAPDATLLPVTRSDPLGVMCDLNSETVADIRQQAEFFVSLGQAQRAINLLHQHIRESIEPHPRVYLDLLTLYHSQGMKTEFRELRLAFNQLFNAVAPDFPAFYQEGRSLMDYPETLSELVRSWPNWQAAALLDACIFRTDQSQLHVGFDLAAFRDLLLLRTLVDNVKTADHNLLATPLDLKAQPSEPAVDFSLSTAGDDNAAVAQATLPASMPVTQSVWLAPRAVPTTEELELEFPIDMLDAVKKPKD